jgi:hypothetical protein
MPDRSTGGKWRVTILAAAGRGNHLCETFGPMNAKDPAVEIQPQRTQRGKPQPEKTF